MVKQVMLGIFLAIQLYWEIIIIILHVEVRVLCSEEGGAVGPEE